MLVMGRIGENIVRINRVARLFQALTNNSDGSGWPKNLLGLAERP
jgi:hypothetical protein